MLVLPSRSTLTHGAPKPPSRSWKVPIDLHVLGDRLSVQRFALVGVGSYQCGVMQQTQAGDRCCFVCTCME